MIENNNIVTECLLLTMINALDGVIIKQAKLHNNLAKSQ